MECGHVLSCLFCVVLGGDWWGVGRETKQGYYLLLMYNRPVDPLPSSYVPRYAYMALHGWIYIHAVEYLRSLPGKSKTRSTYHGERGVSPCCLEW